MHSAFLTQLVIMPLIKKPQLDPSELANYRPISNLVYFRNFRKSCVCSIVLLPAKIISIKNFIIAQKLHLLRLQMTCFLRQTMAASHCSLFNTIDHDILVDRLQSYTGIQGPALRWFRSYLSDRYHFVYLNGE